VTPPAGELLVVRHGETEWSRSGQHTSRTDLPLLPAGEQQARALAARLADRTVTAVVTSPMTRARRTAELAGLSGAVIDDDLREWGYGDLEGVTTRDYVRGHPGWRLWRDGPPGGEPLATVGRRIDAVLQRIRPRLADGDVVVVGHGHASRVLVARWLGLPPDAGRLFAVTVATLTVLGHDHDWPALRALNS
jgi:broad specificity phosphatase PhoE